MKKLFLLVPLVIVLGIGWWLFSPLLFDEEVNEDLPFDLPPRESLSASANDSDSSGEEVEVTSTPESDSSADQADSPESSASEETQEISSSDTSSLTEAEEIGETVDLATPQLLLQGRFQDIDALHKGSGDALVYSLPSGESLLRLENFEVTNGPDLYVVLSTAENPLSSGELGEDMVILERLKGNVGNQNYTIPSGIDISEYQSVAVYCQAFSTLFSTAPLQ